MDLNWKKKNDSEELMDVERAGVPYLIFPALEETGLVSHGFSTRLGGVSEGKFSAMNFTFTRGDDPEHVRENYRRMAKALGVDANRMVLSYQTHTTHIRRITEEDAGKGIIKERDYQDVDGMITDIPGITLVTFYADCVPLYLLDPVHRAIGLSHSGWRGTVGRMGRQTIEAMKHAYGTCAQDLIVCIGPSICQDCFEVGEEVVEEFHHAFRREYWERLVRSGWEDRFQLDLWEANRIIFLEAGVNPANIHVTNRCTHCNPELLFSHRTCGNERGNLAAFLCLSEYP
ncbi:MAG: peptidoglycan editing factor PgeF, partial [Hungatella sp.]